MRALKVFACLILFASFVVAQSAEQKIVGLWEATISPLDKAGAKQFDAGFKFVVGKKASGLQGALYNGPERMEMTSAQFENGELKLGIAYYDGVLALKLDGRGELNGDYTRQTSTGVRHYPVHAVRVSRAFFVGPTVTPHTRESASVGGPSLEGEWVFTTPTDSGADKVASAVFHQGAKNDVHGTIAPVSGDFGLMSGKLIPGSAGLPAFSLSRFDGIHVLLLEGQFDSADTLHGTLNKTSKFTGVRKGAAVPSKMVATVPDAEAVTQVKDVAEVFRFKGVDPKTGKVVTQDDFKGKPVVIDIFGTWCPNCHDEAPVLVDLYKKYHAQGLEIVGLAYEYTDDAQRNARMVDIYRKKFGIGFTLLISGTTGDGEIARTLPELVAFGAYPTTIFIGRDGRVKRIHAGFAGPATGKLEEVKKRFDENVRGLVDE